MSEPMDLDDLLDLWEAELEEDAARVGIMPSCRPAPIHEIPVVEISYKVMLKEVAKGLPASEPIYDTRFRYRGYFSVVKLFVPDPAVPVKIQEERSSSISEFRNAEKAEEKAAEALIRKLERNYGFETRDLNWHDKHRFDLDRFNSGTVLWQMEEENDALKRKIELLTGGWRRTLEGIDDACEVVSSALSTVVETALSGRHDLPVPASAVVSDVADAEEAVCRVVVEGGHEFEQICGNY